jgi:hypothetical protein
MVKVSGSAIIASFVVAIIGLALTPTIATLTTSSSANLSTYSSAQDIIELLPLFWAILVLAIPVVAIGLYFKGV